MRWKMACRRSIVMALCLVLSAFSLFTTAAPARADANSVAEIDWSAFTQGYPTGADATRLKTILLNANKYALNTWYNDVKNFDAQTGTYLNFGGIGTNQIRFPAQEAYALAISIALGAYDPAATGVSLADAKAKTIKLISSLAYRHKANSTSGWGDVWQSALWAYNAGTAGWLLWDDLSASERELVRTMVEHEANRNLPVYYYRNDSGTIIRTGDSGAEENAWNAALLNLATVMMPTHPNHAAWMEKMLKLMITATAMPSDTSNSTVLNGKSVADWVEGSNVNADGTVTNHGFVHPSYMHFTHNIANAILLYGIAGQPVPQAARFNIDKVYDAFIDLSFASPPWDAPGGTIYQGGSWDIYYPDGNDKGTTYIVPHMLGDVIARSFGFDDLVSNPNRKAGYWEDLHAQKLLDMQNRFTDGHAYLSAAEHSADGREEIFAEFAAKAYWFKWMKNQNTVTFTNRSYADSGTDFTDGFETGLSNWTTVWGTASRSSTVSHSGGYSYVVDEDKDAIEHRMSGSTNGKVDMWFYDNASDTSMTVAGNATDEITTGAIGVNTPTSTTKYSYRIGSAWAATSINRTTGWHKLSWDFTSGTDAKLAIDGVQIASTTSLTSFTVVKMGDFWTGDSGTAYFDDVSVVANFNDDFETGLSNWTTVWGTASRSSTVSHSGGYSYAIDEDRDAIEHRMSGNTNGKAEMWFYDNASDTSMTVVGNATDEITTGAIGVNTPTSTTKYSYRIGSTWAATSINRTTGWHKFSWDYTSGTNVKLAIDNVQIASTTAMTSFNVIKLGDFWTGDSGTAYFDDVSVTAN